MSQPHPAAGQQPGFSITDLLHRGSQLAEERFAKCATVAGITPRQLAVLAAAARAPNANQTDLVRMTGVDRSTMADIVRRLVRKNLLQRRRTKEDARAYAICLTPHATELMEQLGADMARAEGALLAALPAEDRSRLIDLLKQLVESGDETTQERHVLDAGTGASSRPV